jgi:hypothetical protein
VDQWWLVRASETQQWVLGSRKAGRLRRTECASAAAAAAAAAAATSEAKAGNRPGAL